MKVAFINHSHNLCQVKDMEFIPPVGSRVDLFYSPMPTVTDVVCLPSDATLKELGIPNKLCPMTGDGICAIIMCG